MKEEEGRSTLTGGTEIMLPVRNYLLSCLRLKRSHRHLLCLSAPSAVRPVVIILYPSPPTLRSSFFLCLAAPLQITVAIADRGQHFNFFSSTFVFHKFCGCFFASSSSFASARFLFFYVPRFIRLPSPLCVCMCMSELSTC